jgi:hypothetical protein
MADLVAALAETLLNAILLFPGRLQRLWKRLRRLARR